MTEDRPTTPTPEGTPPSSMPDAPPPAAAQPPADAPTPAAAPPAYTPPTYTPPPIAPPAAQPTVAWAPPPTTAAAVGQRTTLSLAAGILLVLLGVFGTLISLLILTIGREFARSFDFSTLPGFDTGNSDPGAIVGSVITFFGIVLLVCAVFYIVGGVGVLRTKSWGRVIGIIIGILAGLFWLASLASSGQVNSEAARSSPLFALILLAVHAYVAIALLFFWRNRSVT
jgi:hypothetical protein